MTLGATATLTNRNSWISFCYVPSEPRPFVVQASCLVRRYAELIEPVPPSVPCPRGSRRTPTSDSPLVYAESPDDDAGPPREGAAQVRQIVPRPSAAERRGNAASRPALRPTPRCATSAQVERFSAFSHCVATRGTRRWSAVRSTDAGGAGEAGGEVVAAGRSVSRERFA